MAKQLMEHVVVSNIICVFEDVNGIVRMIFTCLLISACPNNCRVCSLSGEEDDTLLHCDTCKSGYVLNADVCGGMQFYVISSKVQTL